MNRLQRELRRLYLPQASEGKNTGPETSSLLDADGHVRAMVLELARPADWAALSPVWQGVQADLDLPAPAIAVSGKDGLQLWFSLAEPVPAAQAWRFLDALRLRYLHDIQPERLRLLPAAASAPLQPLHAGLVPAVQADSGLWSAFVAPDLAPVFAEEPWLDMPPNDSGQSDLLSRLVSMSPADFQRALAQLGHAVVPAASPPAPGAAAPTSLEPKRFLLDVMNDHTVALGLRIEAAKALLPYFDAPGRR